MAILPIRQYPDAVLKGKAKPVGDITPDIQKLIDDMIDTMYDAPGVGLAAPQVGVPLRLAVIDISPEEDRRPPIVLINPEFVAREGEQDEDEGCLSVKGYNSNVSRYDKVRVKALDRQGVPFEVEGEGYMAKALQHELDHLDGMLFIDRLSPLKRSLFKRRLKKLMKDSVEAS